MQQLEWFLGRHKILIYFKQLKTVSPLHLLGLANIAAQSQWSMLQTDMTGEKNSKQWQVIHLNTVLPLIATQSSHTGGQK